MRMVTERFRRKKLGTHQLHCDLSTRTEMENSLAMNWGPGCRGMKPRSSQAGREFPECLAEETLCRMVRSQVLAIRMARPHLGSSNLSHHRVHLGLEHLDLGHLGLE